MQGEYAKATFTDNRATGVGAGTTPDQDLDTYYVQASYFLTEHTKPYDFKKGVFKSPKLNGEEGAVELKARYDVIENKDIKGNEASAYTVGVNYYATPNTRFMVHQPAGGIRESKQALHYLVMLRETLGDDLVRRSGQGVAPTPRALVLWPSVREALRQGHASGVQTPRG